MTTPLCPLLKKPCIEHQCAFFTHIIGMHPQTGKELDQWDCSVRWLPVLMTEGARQTHNAVAAIESMRNEVVQRQDTLNAAIEQARSRDVGRIEGNVIHYPDGSRGILDGPEQRSDADSRSEYR